MSFYSVELPYQSDAAHYYAALADLPWAVWLDSGGMARYDILTAAPQRTLVQNNDVTQSDPFAWVRRELGERVASIENVPFAGGALGYWGYDLSRRMYAGEDAKRQPEMNHQPVMAIGIYDWALVLDHHLHTARLVSHQRFAETAKLLPQILNRLQNISPQSPDSDFISKVKQGGDERTTQAVLIARLGVSEEANTVSPMKWNWNNTFRVRGKITSNFTPDSYASAFATVQDYLMSGDCYQINLAQRFSAAATGDAFGAYLTLRRLSPAPYSAFLSLPHAQILCASPERFLHVQNGYVETRPIKGTRPRSTDLKQDSQLADELRRHPKDRAENLMIVDLLRNDLGKNCVPGSVRVPKLFEVESYANVHHLVSTVEGQMAEGHDALDVLRDCFPGGSVTGAPKQRAMQIIEQLEPNRRGIYCGAIGYVGFDGNMDSNIVIRTLVYSGSEIRFWVGGGIVADSVCEAEYQETLDKASAMLELLKRYGGEK